MQAVFFYGLFMDESLLREKGMDPSKAIIAFVDGFGLRIGTRATLIKSDKERAYGLIMSLTDQELDILYGEESVSDYIPENLTAVTEKKDSLDVICYNLPLEKLSGQNKQYAKSLAIVAEKVGLPSDYIREIKQWIG